MWEQGEDPVWALQECSFPEVVRVFCWDKGAELTVVQSAAAEAACHT